jgi:hypothetical protein
VSRIALLVITDGRDYLTDTLRSEATWLPPPDLRVLVNDADHKLGLSGAIRAGWRQLRAIGWDGWVFHLEDDFCFPGPVPLTDMARICDHNHLAQVALKRDCANPAEQRVGGFMSLNPANYAQRDGWVESFFGFTFNPCLYRFSTVVPYIEARWAGEAGLTQLMQGERFGIYGSIDDPPRCFHIGHQRADGWKL